MTLQFAISPDHNAGQLAPWFILNTRLQQALGVGCHFSADQDFAAQRKALDAGAIDIIYANAFDTAILVREKGFFPVARCSGRSDEALVAVRPEHPARCAHDFTAPLCVAATDAPDVEMIGRILLEPSGVIGDSLSIVRQANYVLVAKAVISGKADAGFFLANSFDDLSGLVRSQLREVVRSRIYVVRHAWLVSPRYPELQRPLLEALLAMSNDSDGRALLAELGQPNGWAAMSREDAEFMIDLISTLV